MTLAGRLLAIGLFGVGAAFLAGNLCAETGAAKKEAVLAQGQELFTREWQAADKRSHKGDGLGPLFNGASCAACHNLGGKGGGGPNNNNVTLVSAVLMAGPPKSGKDPTPRQPDRATLAEIHPSLRTANSFTLHRFATEKVFEVWKNSLLLRDSELDAEGTAVSPSEPGKTTTPNRSLKITRQVGNWTIQLATAERNTPAIFGSGLIDRIPEKVLEETAAAQARAAKQNEKGVGDIPVSGRVARLKDGRVGRFGWKAQVATLREFALQACANEIGLEVPGFSQPALPWKPGYKAPGLDMTADECDSLVAFVASLDAPQQRRPESEQQKKDIDAGQKLFASVGCAACHQQKLGDVDVIFSDLLLHDMGKNLSDDGEYGTIVPGDGPSDQVEPLPTLTLTDPNAINNVAGVKAKTPKFGAGQQEWRTPPLWGVRDSAPYMHNGAAVTIREAIAMHRGEAKAAASAFAALKWEETVQVEQFLNSLAAPEKTR